MEKTASNAHKQFLSYLLIFFPHCLSYIFFYIFIKWFNVKSINITLYQRILYRYLMVYVEEEGRRRSKNSLRFISSNFLPLINFNSKVAPFLFFNFLMLLPFPLLMINLLNPNYIKSFGFTFIFVFDIFKKKCFKTKLLLLKMILGLKVWNKLCI